MRIRKRSFRVRRRDERGAVAILVAVSLVMLLVATAMVLDFGMVRFDRQRAKSVADSAVMAGLRAADGKTESVFTFRAVCGALDFLRTNDSRLSELPDGICAGADMGATCDPTNPGPDAGDALYDNVTTAGGITSQVIIKSPYTLSDGGFPEEGYASLSGDTSLSDGCDQLGVIIKQSRRPGLGSLATSSDLKLRVRSVGRVGIQAGDVAPALLLLERTRCQVLTNGNSAVANDSRIWVFGSGDTPATIHSDSDASDEDCGSGPNEQLFSGNKANGVVAFASETGTASGFVSSFATLKGVDPDVVMDSDSNIFGTTAVTESQLPGTRLPVTARGRVGRRLVDERYLGGVTTAVRTAHGQWELDHDAPAGYIRFGCPTAGEMTTLAGLGSSTSVYIDCPGSSGITLNGSIGAGRVYFHGFIKNGNLSLPNAGTVYIDNTKNNGNKVSAQALNITAAGAGFCIQTGCTNAPSDACDPPPVASRAQLLVRRGSIESSSMVRFCNTTVIMEGGQLGLGTAEDPGGCLPTHPGTEPTSTPCLGASDPAGSGTISLSGVTDWTAPNAYGDMEAAGLTTDAQKQAAWDLGEDLALWTETYAVSPSYKMAGGAALSVAGVFMVPNAFPMVFSGNADFDLREAQFITRSFAVDGGARLTMQVDPNNAVTLPKLGPFVLVR